MYLTAIYSSISGNTKYVVSQCQTYLTSLGHTLTPKHCSLCSPQDMIESDYTILACPTYGHGQYDAVFADYLTQCSDLDLQGKNIIIVSLGDDRYEPGYLCETASLLVDRVHKHQGTVIGSPLQIVRSPYLPHNQQTIQTRIHETFALLSD